MSHSVIDLKVNPIMPLRKDFRIGIIGSGFIVRDQQIPAYLDAGFLPHAIASRSSDRARAVAARHGIPHVSESWQSLIARKDVDILDIAFPPDCQLEIVREAVRNPHIRGILCQKPLAMNLHESIEIVRLCADSGIKLGVNSNMRYDPSIRALKALMDDGALGTPVLATIEMRAIPHWQKYLEKYDRIEILNMGIHHIDTFRYLFGDPEKITALTRRDPRTSFPHIDGISQYTFQYANELMATSLDDVWAWAGEDTEQDFYIKWRVVGTDGLAEGHIFWFEPGPKPSTIRFTSRKYPGKWHAPELHKSWFPDAFKGTMAQLLRAVEDDALPEISGRDNLHTIACVEACYRSIAEGRTIPFADMLTEIPSDLS